MPEQLKTIQRKKIALALAGSSARAIAYIGMLEVFAEEGIPIDMIAGCSSSSIIACAYASGKMPELKKYLFSLNKKELFSLFQPTMRSGVFGFEKLAKVCAPFLKGENLEDLDIPVSVVASDLVSGESVVFSMGNTIRAINASTAMPGLMEPVIWGNKILIDGGLFSIVPVEAARLSGADIVIGVDMSTTRNAMFPGLQTVRKWSKIIFWPFIQLKNQSAQIFKYISGQVEQGHATISTIKQPGALWILGASLDHAIEQRKKNEKIDCDYLITTDASAYGSTEIESFKELYQLGRDEALKAAPDIKKLLTEKQTVQV